MKIRSTLRAIAIATALATAGAGPATAAEVSVCLHLNSGEKVSFPFLHHPVLTFEGNQLQITYKTSQVSVHDYNTVRKITFDDVSGIRQVADDTGRITSQGGLVTLTGFRAGTTVSVVSVNGQVLLSDTMTGAEPYCIDLSQYSRNVYIITADVVSYKVSN